MGEVIILIVGILIGAGGVFIVMDAKVASAELNGAAQAFRSTTQWIESLRQEQGSSCLVTISDVEVRDEEWNIVNNGPMDIWVHERRAYDV